MTTGIRVGASSSEGQLALVEESVWGTPPANPIFKKTRITSETLTPSKNTVRSNEVRPDRNIVDEIQVGRSVAGNIAFELSYGTFDEILESLMFADWTADKIKNGAGVGSAFTAERKIPLPAGGFEYLRYNGLVANTMSLNVAAGAIVTGEFGFMGKFGGRSAAILSGATYTEPNNNRIMNAATMFSSLVVEGIATPPRIQSLTLNVTNNLRNQTEVGNVDTAGIAAGRFEVSGSFRAYFETGLLYQAFLDHTDLSLAFVLGETAGSRYRFTVPTIVTTGDPGVTIGGNDEDFVANLNFTAVLDRIGTGVGLIGCALQIERAV